MAATSFEIKETILSLPKKSETDVYHTELNIVSWFGKEPKLDIRGWSDDHEKMTKGIKGKFILSYNDCQEIRDLYAGYDLIEVDRQDNLVTKTNPRRYRELIIKNY